MGLNKKFKLPPGYKELKSDQPKTAHFDYVDNRLANEHHGKYLVVCNTKSDTSPHNRLYLCRESFLEYREAIATINMIPNQYKFDTKPSAIQLQTAFPEHKNMIWDVLSVIIRPNMNRKTAELIVRGFGLTLDILCSHTKVPTSLSDFNNEHSDLLRRAIGKMNYNKTQELSITRFFNQLSLHIPNLQIIIGWSKNTSNSTSTNEALPLHVLYQLDYYAQKELNGLIVKANEYEKWMEELAEMELFSLKNLAHSYYKNLNDYGKWSIAINISIRKLSLHLHNIDLKCWKRRANRGISVYDSVEQKLRHQKLIKLAETGIDITPRNEKMFAMWHKTFLPEYPFKKHFAFPFNTLIASEPSVWRSNHAKKVSISLRDFDSRIFPGPNDIYPLYLILLIRSGLNQEVLKNWTVTKDKKGDYKLGEESGFGLMVDGEKVRGNTIQTAVFGRGTKEMEYINFFLKWITPIYEHSNSKCFFQYINYFSRSEVNNIQVFQNTLYSMMKQKNGLEFFYKNNVIEMKELDGKNFEERLTGINHQRIRPTKNFSNYLKGYNAFERQRNLGHKDSSTEPLHYRNSVEWKKADNHKIAASQLIISQFFRGEITAESNEKLKVFNTPMSNCVNPLNPTYPGSPKLKNDEVCTNWRKCLTYCDQCKVLPKIHGPVIMAWKECMERMQDDYYHLKDWEKEFILDYNAACTVLDLFTEEDLLHCKSMASNYSSFVQRIVFTSHKKRKAVQ